MGFISRVRTVLRVMRRAKRPMEPVRLFGRRPALLFGVNFFEISLLANGRTPERIKALASIKTSALVGCPF